MRATVQVFLSAILVQMRNVIVRPIFQVVLFFQPIVISANAYMIYRNVEIENFPTYIILGGGLAGIWSVLTFSSVGDLHRERYLGMLQPILAAPTSAVLVFTAKIVANACLSLIALLITILYSWFLLGVAVAVPHLLAFLFALVAFLFSASSFALMLGSIFILWRAAYMFQNVIEFPLLILGGVAFPVTILPWWAQQISLSLPMRWGSEALRATFAASPLDERYWQAVGWTFLLGLLYYTIAILMFRLVEHRVRVSALLEAA
jgi:ABC-2 type transport system permease protein